MAKTPTKHSAWRLTLILVSLLGLILTSVFLSRRSVYHIQAASASLYKDRLVPTALIANLTQQVYQRRLLLETYVLGKTKPDASLVTSSINRMNHRVDSLLTDFAQTKLTQNEVDKLTQLKQRLAVYNQLELETITLNDLTKAKQILFTGTGNTSFSELAQSLTELATLQLSVGAELIDQSRGQTNYIYVLTALQIGLVLLVGLSLFWHRF